MPDILNDVEKAAVQKFIEFETMREAVKKVLLAALYENGTLKPGIPADPTRNASFAIVANQSGASNEQIGAELRAMWEGVRIVENAFNKMAEYKKVEPEKPKPNKAR
jgi:hypothetical protein